MCTCVRGTYVGHRRESGVLHCKILHLLPLRQGLSVNLEIAVFRPAVRQLQRASGPLNARVLQHLKDTQLGIWVLGSELWTSQIHKQLLLTPGVSFHLSNPSF